ncbi:MAG: UPF0164 family protein [Treponemataceae bacterium]|nr:UPF0164 family protein [Treponemataceae bacterium]
MSRLQKALVVLPSFLITIFNIPLFSLDIQENLYGSVNDYLQGIFGIDENEGLSALPILSIPLGGKVEGMGTASAALTDTAAALERNPAVSARLERTELALYHNNWIADTKIEGLLYTRRLEYLGFGAVGKWLYLPFTEYNDYGERASKGFYSEGVALVNASYTFFPGYYFAGLSVGVNLKAAFRLVPDYSDNNGAIKKGSGLSQSAVALMVDTGLLTTFNFLKYYSSRERNTAVALVFKNVGFPVGGDPLPTEITAGVSYKPVRPLQVAFDVTVPFNVQDPSLSERPYWATGISANLTSFVSMHGGVLAKTGNVRLTVGSAIQVDVITLDINYTLDLLSQLTPLNRVSLAVQFNLGDEGRAERARKVDELYLLGLTAYAQGNYESALHYWNQALGLDPAYDPAKEGIQAIQGVQALTNRIEKIQKIE